MSRRLAIDVGNTRTKWACFRAKDIAQSGILDRFHVPALERLVEKFRPSYVILSSTKHLSKRMQHMFDTYPHYLELNIRLKFPFRVAYKTPETLGKDRIASIAGAWSLFPQQSSMVVDAGSCITYDVITQDGVYRGGNISPGVRMRLDAMHQLTDRLPQVAPSGRYIAMGEDTRSALQAGAEAGAVQEVRGFINEYKKEFGNLNILLTGGDAQFFVNNIKTEIFAAPQLVLIGLNEILEYNVESDT